MVTKTTKSINRGTLKRAAKAGKLWVRCKYHMTDDYAFDNANKFGEMEAFRKAYLFVELDSERSREIEAQIEDAYRGESRDEARISELMNELRELRRENQATQRDANHESIVVHDGDFSYKSGSISGDKQSGTWWIHRNLCYEYQIR